MLRISVVISTHNRARFLGDCLISLCEQDLPPDAYEICVVNNLCTDATPEVVKKIAEHFPSHSLYMVNEPKLGLSNARNCGIRETHAPLIAFGDDDATMPPDWLTRIIARFDEFGPEVGKVGGEIEPVWGAPRPSWLSDKMLPMLTASSGLGKEAKFSDYPIVECNCCYSRAALEAVGGFPAHLGRIGKSLLSNDHVIDWMIRASGFKLFYDPAITLKHFIHADRLTPKWFRRRYFWQGISDYVGILYLNRHNLTLSDDIRPILPESPADWAFTMDEGSTGDLDVNLHKLHWLGFMLAKTGLIEVEGA